MATLKEYLIKLVDTDNEEVTLWKVETDKSLEQFDEAYHIARSDWYNEESPVGLDEYIIEMLEEQGFYIVKVVEDLKLDF